MLEVNTDVSHCLLTGLYQIRPAFKMAVRAKKRLVNGAKIHQESCSILPRDTK